MQQKKVMIVEDEGLIANDIADQLRKGGFEITEICASGEEALASLRNSAPDLVLMDIRLKGKLDGIEAALRIRAEYKVPVVFLTSHADAATLAKAKQAEPYGYVVKPFRQLSLCSAIEIALHKHDAERALVEREAWLTTVLQAISDPTIVVDANGAIQFLNTSAERLLSCVLADVAGLKWHSRTPLFHQVSGKKADDLVERAMLGSATVKLPLGIVLRKGEGDDLAVEGEVSPSIRQGNVVGAVITIRDVSGRNQEEAEVREQHKMSAISRLAGGIAHDFNNLLTVIIGHGTLLSARLSDPDDLTSIEALLEGAHAAAETARQLLTLSRKTMLKSEILAVNDCVGRVARMISPSLGSNVDLSLDLDKDAGRVRMNGAQLDQIVLNLTLNARDAMPNGGTILISTSRFDRVVNTAAGDVTETFARVTVADSGEGMSAEVQEHIFEPFFTTKRKGGGTGLGLAMVYAIVKDAGGEIKVRSRPQAGAVVSPFAASEDGKCRRREVRVSRRQFSRPDDPVG